jgi:hypothetical protein
LQLVKQIRIRLVQANPDHRAWPRPPLARIFDPDIA